jgi:superfamily I DNA and/or RNA helicase
MARREFGLTRQAFDLVIIDEAGKAFGAELFVPALRARKLIVVGDHHQLPPTVTTDALDERVGYRLELHEVEDLLRESYFGKLFEKMPADAKGMLTMQYRMHPEIGRVVSDLFYESKLESAPRHDDMIQQCPFRSRVSFIDFTGLAAYRSSLGPLGISQRNDFEASVAVDLLQQLSRARVLQETLVVCPYEAQRSAVAALISRRLAGTPIRVTTVDAVQGGEAPFVLLLMTRSRGPVQFLLDRHRMNVALSRAKEAVIILGHAEQLCAHEASPIRQLLGIEGVRRVRVDPRAPGAVAAELCSAAVRTTLQAHRASRRRGRGARS